MPLWGRTGYKGKVHADNNMQAQQSVSERTPPVESNEPTANKIDAQTLALQEERRKVGRNIFQGF